MREERKGKEQIETKKEMERTNNTKRSKAQTCSFLFFVPTFFHLTKLARSYDSLDTTAKDITHTRYTRYLVPSYDSNTSHRRTAARPPHVGSC